MAASSRGPAQRRYTATVNAAQARRSAIDMHTSGDADSVAEAALALFQAWQEARD